MIVFDLDGTLADTTHRLHFIQRDPKDWDAFHRACVDDPPIQEMIDTLVSLHDDHFIEIWTGRSELVRKETVEWLAWHAVPYGQMLMRPIGDHRPDDVLKAGWLSQVLPITRITLAFDDRKRVADMWRRHGIRCCLVAEGDF